MPPVRKPKPSRVSASKRSTPLATPATFESNPVDQWVWSALDIARRAAMADDLAHVPSIKKIGDIFTRMLGGLQAMKSNRDKFYVITNDIGSLIDSVIQYGREQKTVSERYRTLCDDFLSTMSSMQSEMKPVFGGSRTSTKRISKAKTYPDVLSSYQFRARSLRSDLQALMATTTSNFLSNASVVVVPGGVFTEIQGNQYIFHNHGTTDAQTLLNDTTGGQTSTGRIDDLDFSDYTILKYGDLRAISVPRGRFLNICDEYTVRIRDLTLTARTRKGDSALNSFKEDVKIILEHNFRHPHVVQLFGVCPSKKVPTMIFHGDLRPFDLLYPSVENIPNDPSCPSLNFDLRKSWHLTFQIIGGLQAGFHYLMQEYQLQDLEDYVLTPEGQLLKPKASHLSCIPLGGAYFSNCSCYFYLDDSLQFQISIEPPLAVEKRPFNFTSYVEFPKLLSRDMEVINDVLLSYGTIPDGCQIDRRACLLAIYDVLAEYDMFDDPGWFEPSMVVLVSQMRHARAARLELGLGGEHLFTWSGWKTWPNVRFEWQNEQSHVTIENTSWTRFTVPRTVPSARCPKVRYGSTFTATSLYLRTWLAQGERIMSQIASYFTNREYHTLLVTGIECNFSFQSCFSSPFFQELDEVYLFVQDLQSIDDAFEMRWFWAKDPRGLQRLRPVEMLWLGLDEIRKPEIYLEKKGADRRTWEQLRIFHELFGFATGSLEVSRFLGLPIATLEWDGDENGPLTPLEFIDGHL